MLSRLGGCEINKTVLEVFCLTIMFILYKRFTTYTNVKWEQDTKNPIGICIRNCFSNFYFSCLTIFFLLMYPTKYIFVNTFIK